MEKLDFKKLMGQAKEYDIGGVKLVLQPLTVKELGVLMKTAKPDTQAEGMTELLTKTLKKSYPETTDEEIQNISLEHFQKLTEAMLDVNGIDIKKLNPMKE